MSGLVTITGDGTFRLSAAQSGGADTVVQDPALEALLRLRSLLGDQPEEQIGTRLYLPSALGLEDVDHLLPSSLALLAGISGDLASYGWRLGPGMGRAWRRTRELRERLADAARIALFGYEGPLAITAMGPLTLAAATYLLNGERTLSDHGALQDLPMLLAEGIGEQVDALRERVPRAQLHLVLREDAIDAVVAGRIPTPSGRRRYPAVPAPEVGVLWQRLLAVLGSDSALAPESITLGVVPDQPVLRAVREIGARNLAIAPARLPSVESAAGRLLWEELAEHHDTGGRLELVVDPRPGQGMQAALERTLESWCRLGYGPSDLAGSVLVAHTGASHIVTGDHGDPAQQPQVSSLLDETTIQSLLRAAPAWGERIQH